MRKLVLAILFLLIIPSALAFILPTPCEIIGALNCLGYAIDNESLSITLLNPASYNHGPTTYENTEKITITRIDVFNNSHKSIADCSANFNTALLPGKKQEFTVSGCESIISEPYGWYKLNISRSDSQAQTVAYL